MKCVELVARITSTCRETLIQQDKLESFDPESLVGAGMSRNFAERMRLSYLQLYWTARFEPLVFFQGT